MSYGAKGTVSKVKSTETMMKLLEFLHQLFSSFLKHPKVISLQLFSTDVTFVSFWSGLQVTTVIIQKQYMPIYLPRKCFLN